MSDMRDMFQWKNEENEKLNINHCGDVVYLSFPQLDRIPDIRHGFSTRLGGVSEGICASMNLSFTRGDREEDVFENYRRISEAIGFSAESIVCSDQTHTANVRIVTKQDCGYGITREKPYADVDGLVTNEAGVTLATFYADCVPLYLVDSVKKVIGLSHSGWKGTVGKIGKVTVETMVRDFDSNPADICVAVGPSICQECYEVSEDVIEQFRAVFTEEQCGNMIIDKGNGKYQLDLWQACRYNFLAAGILPDHISLPNICTCCNPEVLFSHRASQGKRGNLAAFLCIT